MTTRQKISFYTKWRNKNVISILIFSLYFIPLITTFLTFAAFPGQGKTLLALFTLLLCCGSIALIITLKSIIEAQNKLQHTHSLSLKTETTPEIDPQQVLKGSCEHEAVIIELTKQIDIQKEHIESLQVENVHLNEQLNNSLQEADSAKKHSAFQHQQLLDEVQSERDKAAKDYAESINQKNNCLDEQQEVIRKLQQELANTKFELETLLKLEIKQESDINTKKIIPPSSLTSPALEKQAVLPPSLYTPAKPSLNVTAKKEAKTVMQLNDQKLVYLLDKTKELSKTGHSAREQLELPTFLDLSLDTLAIEKRRLIDVLKAESDLPSFIINCQDAKLIFVSPGIKAVTGIAPDRFQKDFFNIVGHSKEHIRNALALLKPSEKTKIPIQLKTGPHEEHSIVLSLGVCPLLPFSRSAIGILEISEAIR